MPPDSPIKMYRSRASGGKTSDLYDKFPEATFFFWGGDKSCQSFATQIHFNQKNSGGVGHLHCSSNMIGVSPPKKATLTEHVQINVTIVGSGTKELGWN